MASQPKRRKFSWRALRANGGPTHRCPTRRGAGVDAFRPGNTAITALKMSVTTRRISQHSKNLPKYSTLSQIRWKYRSFGLQVN